MRLESTPAAKETAPWSSDSVQGSETAEQRQIHTSKHTERLALGQRLKESVLAAPNKACSAKGLPYKSLHSGTLWQKQSFDQHLMLALNLLRNNNNHHHCGDLGERLSPKAELGVGGRLFLYFFFQIKSQAGETVSCFELPALSEDLGSVPGTHMAADSQL